MTITTAIINDDAVKYYTLAEVAQNNGKDGKPMWIMYKYSVYDVTAYVKSGAHPGDDNLITDHAGKDCTRDFNDAGHSKDAMREMKTMKIGEVFESERKGSAGKKIAPTPSMQSIVSMSEDGEKKRKRRFLLCR